MKPRKRVKQGKGDSKAFTARSLVADYLRLCHDPLKDLGRWLAEDKKHDRALRSIASLMGGKNERADTGRAAIGLGQIGRFRLDALRELCSRMGEDGRPGGRHADHVPARSGAGAGGHHQLQSLSTERGKIAFASPVAVDCSYPDAMLRELQAVKTPADYLAWQLNWAEHLSGRAAQYKIAQAQPERPRQSASAQRRFAR